MPFFNKAHLLRCRLTIEAPAHLTESAVGVDLDGDKGTVGIRCPAEKENEGVQGGNTIRIGADAMGELPAFLDQIITRRSYIFQPIRRRTIRSHRSLLPA